VTVALRLAEVRARIARAAARAGRDVSEITLIAVSKAHPASAALEAVAAGCSDLGESYVQEWVAKRDLIPADVRWHFIGHLQSNKVRDVIGRAALIHSVDRASLVAAIARRAEGAGLVQDVLIEVNVGGEASKSGCGIGGHEALAAAVAAEPSLRLRGLMTVAPPFDDPEGARPIMRQLRVLRDDLRTRYGSSVSELSMGMTDDLEVAVEEGATLVRVGTAIFGQRSYPA
jgi:pyridoxal phosphate enzyme (YggS family)